MEHVEVNEKMQTHNLFRDTICGNNAYGADFGESFMRILWGSSHGTSKASTFLASLKGGKYSIN